MTYALPIAVVIVLYFFSDDLTETFYSMVLQSEDATCGHFQDAPAAVQAAFLQDCGCLDETGDDDKADATAALPLDAVEACVREAVMACSKDDSLHQIYRTCATPNDARDKSG